MDYAVFVIAVALIVIGCALSSIEKALKNTKNNDDVVVFFEFPSETKVIEELSLAMHNLGSTQEWGFNNNYRLALYNEGKKNPIETWEDSWTSGFDEDGPVVFRLTLKTDQSKLLLRQLLTSPKLTKKENLTQILGRHYYIYQ